MLSLRRQQNLWILGLALGLGGCSDNQRLESEYPQAIGELGNGTFLYVDCEPGRSVPCRRYLGGFPYCMALEGRFRLDYVENDGTTRQPYSLTETYFGELGGGAFEARAPGQSAIVVEDSIGVVDYLHLTAVQLDDIEVVAVDGSVALEPLTVRTGSTTSFALVPRYAGCPTTGGLLSVDARSSRPQTLEAVGGYGLTIRALAPGQGAVTIHAAGFERVLDVVVVDPPSRPEPELGDTEGESGGAESSGTGATGGSSETTKASGSSASQTGTDGSESGTTGGES